MDAESMLDEFAVGLGEHLARYGFEADEWTFRRSAEHGDTLIVEFQQSELWTGEEAHFYINIFFSLRPKWEFDCARLGLDESDPPRGALGKLLGRLRPRGWGDGETWRIANQATMDDVAQQVRGQLDELLPGYLGLLDRAELMDRAGEIWGGGRWRIQGWILAQRGPSAELERLLAEREAADPGLSDMTGLIRGYARTKT